MDEWDNTTLADDDISKEFVQPESERSVQIDQYSLNIYVLFVVSDGKLKMTRDDTLFLVVTSSIAGQLKNFSSEVLENSSKVDCQSDQQ